ncbi:cyclin-domain-containing protein [Infundibulicybe gibba]|nr:cyclin-domain-containing protein [Infundibulicybe gibba]
MAFYTPTYLPRTPSAYTMNATLPSLPTELLSSWSLWRNPKPPLTPPMTSTFQSRTMRPVRMTLPPIAHLERHIPGVHPLTPPAETQHSPEPPHLPPILDLPMEAPADDIFQSRPVVDWLDFTRTRSAHFIAEKTCEMICYLWFSVASPEQSYPSPTNSPPFLPRPNSATTTLQLLATPTFVQFMQKLLETTQVSQSVIVLSLHYIYRLKERNRFTPAQAGSEFRIAVAGLMMANKFLDDNTYTNKTWSEVSGIELEEINRMEREFLLGVDFNLYVDKPTYEAWLNLLKGLVMAKERDSRQFRKSRGLVRASKLSHPNSSTGPSTRTYSTRHRSSSHRARSTSPGQTLRTYPFLSHQKPTLHTSPAVAESPSSYSPTPRSGSKRSAEAAFSPTSAAFSQVPSKRPIPTSLHIPELAPLTAGPHSHSPLESLQSFAKMTLASPHAPPPSSRTPVSSWSSGPRDSVPETLVTPYALDEDRRQAVPQNLYFYTLACSPMDSEEETRSRKARLRYHQPPPPNSAPYYPPAQPSLPVVQSASASPHDIHMNVTSHSLPHFHDTVWSRPSVSVAAHPYPQHQHIHQPQPEPVHYYPSQEFSGSPIPSAPFANAGPPGVHFYPTPVQRSSSVYPPPNWSRSRRH